uniref:Uncharacterized protein n=1 Tax=Anopheles maculatus TaxID=74869 RepID=A0A182T9F1_9DIPT
MVPREIRVPFRVVHRRLLLLLLLLLLLQVLRVRGSQEPSEPATVRCCVPFVPCGRVVLAAECSAPGSAITCRPLPMGLFERNRDLALGCAHCLKYLPASDPQKKGPRSGWAEINYQHGTVG